MRTIYEPKGRAREYAELAVNLFETCQMGCEYCYAPKVLHKKPEEFHAATKPRRDIIQKISADARQLSENKDKREILLCFTCDPYQSDLQSNKLVTRMAVQTLLASNLNISILTKGGNKSLADLCLLSIFKDQVRYGATLVFACDRDSRMYEPHAAPTGERIRALKTVHDKGIRTWVSLEPAWSIPDALKIIDKTHTFTDTYKIGKLNYHPHSKEVNWADYLIQVTSRLQELNKSYYVKEDLRRYAKPL